MTSNVCLAFCVGRLQFIFFFFSFFLFYVIVGLRIAIVLQSFAITVWFAIQLHVALFVRRRRKPFFANLNTICNLNVQDVDSRECVFAHRFFFGEVSGGRWGLNTYSPDRPWLDLNTDRPTLQKYLAILALSIPLCLLIWPVHHQQRILDTNFFFFCSLSQPYGATWMQFLLNPNPSDCPTFSPCTHTHTHTLIHFSLSKELVHWTESKRSKKSKNNPTCFIIIISERGECDNRSTKAPNRAIRQTIRFLDFTFN